MMDRVEWRERFEERAAIMEFHGGMSREEAERKAREDIETIARRGEQEALPWG